MAITLASEPPGNKVALKKPLKKSTHNAESENHNAISSNSALKSSSTAYPTAPYREYDQFQFGGERLGLVPMDKFYGFQFLITRR